MAWWAYRVGKLISYRAFRVYLALHEVQERRDAASRTRRRDGEPACEPRYAADKLVDEVHAIVGGVGGEHIRAEFRALKRAGLVSATASRILFDESPDRMPVEDLASLWAMCEQIPNRKRRVPVPRSMLKYIAGGARAAVAATMFGQVLRCLYWKGGKCHAEGSCSTSFVAEVFGVHQRTVKDARLLLRRIGWLVSVEADHWHVQQHGGRGVINLFWSRADVAQPGGVETESPPPKADSTTESAPPVQTENLPSGYKNQEPAKGRPAGVFVSKGREKRPDLRRMVYADLSTTWRLVTLFSQAVTRGLLSGSEHDRLTFVSLAEHAIAYGRDAVRLFSWLLRHPRCWSFINIEDEEAARRRLIEHDRGDIWKREPEERPKVRPARVELSEDARFARAVIKLARENRVDDEFHWLKRSYPEWTRERWEKAVGELENARLSHVAAARRMDAEVVAW